jgi:hypothetical protein
MRFESTVASISWIPSEAISGLLMKLPFNWGLAHYDQPPPDLVGDLNALRDADRFRFANDLRAWIEVEDGRIVGFGQTGGGLIGSTTLRVGSREATFQAIALPDLCPEPVVTDDAVVFTQTAGGRTGVPAPRRVRRAPFVQFSAPLAWTTLSLTMRADGSSSHELTGASPFPRHWVYGATGQLEAKSGVIDFSEWSKSAFGKHSPWGDADSAALSTAVETALERELSVTLMQGDVAPLIRNVKAGDVVTAQGAEEDEIFLVLDGVVSVDVDGELLVELGPGALLGERALLEGGKRTSTLRAVTACKLAVVPGDRLDRQALEELSKGHRREDERG